MMLSLRRTLVLKQKNQQVDFPSLKPLYKLGLELVISLTGQ